LKRALIPLQDVECLTQTIIDIPNGVENLFRKKGIIIHVNCFLAQTHSSLDALKLAQDQFLPLCRSWDYQDWDEFDYDRIKVLKFKEIDIARRKAGQEATQRECLKCPKFLEHVSKNTNC
jgi:antiviral helicase SKI2